MKDPYEVLGVARNATADAIKQAYRSLAREFHPDVNSGDQRAEERFKEVSAAYDFLSDADRRARYDNDEIDATGAPRRRWRARSSAGRADSDRAGRHGFGFGDDAEDILAELLRRKERGRSQRGGPGPGKDLRHRLTVSFIEAALGASKRVGLPTGKSLDVRVPAGSVDGQVLRLKGQGFPVMMGGPEGDAYIEIHVTPHPVFVRRDFDVLADIPVSLQEAVLGGKVTVPTLDGKVALTVPPGSNTGTILRLKGKGFSGPNGKGDQLVTLRVVLPENDADLRKFVEKWGPKHSYDPRSKGGE